MNSFNQNSVAATSIIPFNFNSTPVNEVEPEKSESDEEWLKEDNSDQEDDSRNASDSDFTPDSDSPSTRRIKSKPQQINYTIADDSFQPMIEHGDDRFEVETSAGTIIHRSVSYQIDAHENHHNNIDRPYDNAAIMDDITLDSDDDDESIGRQSKFEYKQLSSTAGTRRTVCIKRTRKRIKNTSSKLMDQGHLDLRPVWLNFSNEILKMASRSKLYVILLKKTRMNGFYVPISLSSSFASSSRSLSSSSQMSNSPELLAAAATVPLTPAERKINEELDDDFHAFQRCCGSNEIVFNWAFQYIGDPTMAPIVNKVKSLFTLQGFLRSRLEYHSAHEFNPEVIKNTTASLIRSQPGAKPGEPCFVWHNTFYKVCIDCLCDLAGNLTASTLRRIELRLIYGKEPSKASRIYDTETAGNYLIEYAKDQGDILPNPEGKADGINYVLHHRTQALCGSFVSTWIRENKGVLFNISKWLMSRTMKELREKNIFFNIKKWKGVARCEACDLHENTIEKCRQEGDKAGREAAEMKKIGHFREATEQRNLFSSKKQMALSRPWDLMTITLDGMDQSKTNLPHFTRVSKNAEVQSDHLLKVRVVGAFCYGSPVPVLGFTCFDDIASKGGNASVTIIERMLDIAYESMDEKCWANIPGSKFCTVDDEGKNIIPEGTTFVDSSDKFTTPHSDPTIDPPSSSVPKKVPFMWPEGLHFTFDNTPSDAKNAHVFNFFACLVGQGIVQYITVSNLMVGHTHDIVDQMFSVWSRLLHTNDAPTLYKMHQLFKENYKSKIYAVKELLDQVQATASAVLPERSDSTSTSSSSATSSSSIGSVPQPKQSKLSALQSGSPETAQRLRDLAGLLGVEPQITLQTFTVDAKEWCFKPIEHITVPHVFYIVGEYQYITPERRQKINTLRAASTASSSSSSSSSSS